MRDAQKPDHVSLNTLINYLKDGRYVIPDFQREFEWQPWDVKELMRSIFLDYYIGSLLLWKGKKENFEALSCESMYGYSGNGKPEYIVLDGQQRLTALYYAFLAPDKPLPNRTNRFVYYVSVDRFMAEDWEKAFNYEWLTRRLSKILEDKDAQFREHFFPLSVVGAGGWELANWMQGYEQFWRRKVGEATESGIEPEIRSAALHASNAKAFGKHIKDITEEYQISYIELDRDLEVDKVCDIFTQINSRGIRLDVFDLINALLKPKGLGLKKMWREAAPKLAFVQTGKMNVYILQIMSILLQAYCSPKYLYFMLPGQEKTVRNEDGSSRKEVLVGTIAEFENQWNAAVKSLEGAIRLLRHPQEYGAISSNYLPYVSILPVFSALQSHLDTLPSFEQLGAQRKFRHWYWAAVFTSRYSGSVESTSSRDFLDVRAWFGNDECQPAVINEFSSRFRSLDLRKESKRGSSIYNGIFNLLVLQGAKDLLKGKVPQYDDLDDHHIVPASWGDKYLRNGLVHSILNRTPLTADSNRRVIRDRLPNTYLPELIKSCGEPQLREILDTHFISKTAQDILLRDPFTESDFESFLDERKLTIQNAIESLLVKGRLDLTPPLRELDEHIEEVELKIRRTIDEALSREPLRLPSHILQKIDERIQSAVRRNPAIEMDHYNTLIGKLEYCDLRELQESIVSKALWPVFEMRFGTKESLAVRFDQLAVLRNSIRHSRTVDEIARKDGETAVLWFRQVLQL